MILNVSMESFIGKGNCYYFSSPLKTILVEEYHSTPTGGHAGVAKTYSCLSADVVGKGTRKEVSDPVSKCKVCISNKVPKGAS